MSLHDKLAQHAILMGKTSMEFSTAAQKHANTTWFFVMAAAVVWYFLGWIWALIPFSLSAFTAIRSISASMIASRLENLEEALNKIDQ